jgi:hypothetical protein
MTNGPTFGDSQASLLETLISNSLDTSMFPELSNGFASRPIKTKGNYSFLAYLERLFEH